VNVALLDVNLLVALFYDQHAQHELAHDWFEDHKQFGWATCAISENGVVRILSNREIIPEPWRPTVAIERLREFRNSGHHRFWAESVSLTDDALFNRSVFRGHKQITDIYLLGLAKSAGGSLATFDQSIPLAAVKGATKATLQVISAAPEESKSEDR
jgi:toxin-antitoxin system PIN domain toxin